MRANPQLKLCSLPISHFNKMNESFYFPFILTQVMAVIVTELDMKLRPLFMLTWRVADLKNGRSVNT